MRRAVLLQLNREEVSIAFLENKDITEFCKDCEGQIFATSYSSYAGGVRFWSTKVPLYCYRMF